MKTFHAFPLNPIVAMASQVIIAGADGIAVASPLKTINGQSLLGSGDINVTVDLSDYATLAAVAAGYQPLDSDLTAIAALTTTSFGRALLALADAAAARAAIGAGDALTSNPLSQFAATTSAQLRGVLSDETGSGAAVFATSPTLVTPNIGAATGTSLALSGDVSANQFVGKFYQAQTLLTAVDATTNGLELASGKRLSWSSTVESYGTTSLAIGQASSGVMAIYTGSAVSNTTLGSLNLANLNASGTVTCANITASGIAKFAGYPTGLLPAAASNAGSITYDTTLAKHVGCNGSSWNALW